MMCLVGEMWMSVAVMFGGRLWLGCVLCALAFEILWVEHPSCLEASLLCKLLFLTETWRTCMIIIVTKCSQHHLPSSNNSHRPISSPSNSKPSTTTKKERNWDDQASKGKERYLCEMETFVHFIVHFQRVTLCPLESTNFHSEIYECALGNNFRSSHLSLALIVIYFLWVRNYVDRFERWGVTIC